jgi:hypothetical protein
MMRCPFCMGELPVYSFVCHRCDADLEDHEIELNDTMQRIFVAEALVIFGIIVLYFIFRDL